MSSRRIARELAVILLPQLPKDKKRLEKVELDKLVSKAVQMLIDYAKQCLSEANGYIVKAQEQVNEQELDHPDNAANVHSLKPVRLTTDQLKEHLDLMERALHLTSEALDVPQMKVETQDTEFLHKLVSAYIEHRPEIDGFINKVQDKWRLDRMVSIDRDIIRLACAEAFFLPEVPINVCISEAVELSHRFADAKAAKFINGVLSDLAEEAKTFRATGKFTPGETGATDGTTSSSVQRS
jgi:N utilization substance protein B